MTEHPRRYESLRREEQARQTRAAIADAARRLFLRDGWAATTVRAVAREAGVSAPTVYAAYGNKRGLTQALVEAADLSADLTRQFDELEAAEGDPKAQLAAMAGYDRRLFERAGDLILLVRDAGRTEPELADAYRHARRGADHTRAAVFSAWPQGTLRPGLAQTTATDLYAALCSIDLYVALTTERGWTPDQVEHWWADALPRELLNLQAP